MKCVEAALFHEARGEPEEGIRGVLEVIVNRKNHKDYPDSLCGVILQPSQFSFVKEKGKKALDIKFSPVDGDKQYLIRVLAYMAAVDSLGTSQRALGSTNILHFTTTKIRPKWSKSMKIHATLGNHRFYLKEKP